MGMEHEQSSNRNSTRMLHRHRHPPTKTSQEPIEHNVRLTSTEMGLLWTAYLSDSMAICVLKHFLQHIDDAEIEDLLKQALHVSQGHIESIADFMNQENFPIPVGFNDMDVNLNAPRLFSDAFYLSYLDGMAMMGMVTYTAASASATRKDIRKFYNACHLQGTDLHNSAIDLQLEKGLFVRPPLISAPDAVDFVEDRKYLSGFFGKHRPLNAIEITNLYLNTSRNGLGKALITGFAQIAQSKIVRQYMERGKDISAKHVKIFSDILNQNDLPAPVSREDEVTDSTETTFSDKLLMFHVAALCASGIGNYGVAMGTSPRRDLGLTFARIQAEVALYAEDGAEIAIDNDWLEEPPMVDNRKDLARLH